MDENKFNAVLQQFGTVESAEITSTKVQEILAKSFEKNFTPEVLATIYGCIDLTTLNSHDTKEAVRKMVEKVNQSEGTFLKTATIASKTHNQSEGTHDLPNVAAICTYPVFVETVKQTLLAKDVKVASVAAGFPSSQTFRAVKIAETAMAIAAGADEIDIVINLGCFFEEAYKEITDEIVAIKDSCRGATLKVILETGALVSPEMIQRATILSLYSGADFIKTSTGKGYPGATPEAFYTICKTVREYQNLTGKKIGVKVSGGVRIAEEAVRYYTIAEQLLGVEWLRKDLFRIGASNLIEDIVVKVNQMGC